MLFNHARTHQPTRNPSTADRQRGGGSGTATEQRYERNRSRASKTTLRAKITEPQLDYQKESQSTINRSLNLTLTGFQTALMVGYHSAPTWKRALLCALQRSMPTPVQRNASRDATPNEQDCSLELPQQTRCERRRDSNADGTQDRPKHGRTGGASKQTTMQRPAQASDGERRSRRQSGRTQNGVRVRAVASVDHQRAALVHHAGIRACSPAKQTEQPRAHIGSVRE